MAKRAVLAYSGGLDTSVAVKWMQENLGCEVIAMAVDVGQEANRSSTREADTHRAGWSNLLRGDRDY